ncbi:MAG: SDR family NAD(P)-dependent oxidoreductase [Parasutterella excrementihominis]|uniref:SDR family NAD(P)-dependent oxidoreductase n=1 Tax=Parasutterella excrementihominis TaxID=487175 RepID=UPI0039A0382E
MEEFSETLLSEGEQVIVTARKPKTIQHFAKNYPLTALCLRLDVTKKDTIDATVNAAIEKFGKIDVLINNAGYCLRGAVEECTEEEIYAEFNTNFFGAVRMIQAVLPHMRKAGIGAIINYSSIAALDTSAGSAFYGAAKCALEGLSCGLRKEVEPLGIKVMVVEPGPFKTDFFDRSIDINPNRIAAYDDTANKRKVKISDLSKVDIKWCDMGRACKLITDIIQRPDAPHHILLGSMAVEIGEKFVKDRSEEIQKWKEASESLDA